MKRKLTLGTLLALAATVPAVTAPRLVSQANAQNAGVAPANAQPAEYPDVPKTHWAYDALNRLSQAGVIEGRPGGTYNGNEPMTRYEFAVAIARLLQRIQVTDPFNPEGILARLTTLEGRPVPDIFRADVVNLIDALRNEFRDELNRLGVRVGELEGRVGALENRVPAPNKFSMSLGLLHRAGYANYLDAGPNGRTIFNPAGGIGNQLAAGDVALPFRPGGEPGNTATKRFSYTDLELRLTDRVTDRLSATAALRSLGSTQEDPWTGDSGGGVYIRELYAVADLSDRSIIGIKGLTAILGRQRTKIAQGLLYDNQLAPTDQIHGMFRLGPVSFDAFSGSTNNQTISGQGNGDGGNPYRNSGANFYLGTSGIAEGAFGGNQKTSAAIGFSGGNAPGTVFTEDNESLVHGAVNLFRIGGQPVQLGATAQFDGYAQQKGNGFDLTLPLFNRVVGFEYVRQGQYADGSDPQGGRNPGAYIVTVPALRTKVIDLDLAYGRANDNFEYFSTSAANPFARSYGEALFDRPLFLGAPMIAGGASNGVNGSGVRPIYMAAKKGYDISGTLRLPVPVLRRIPLDFRYYKARGTDGINLGKVYTVGTVFNVTPGLDFELKYGHYNAPGATTAINYYRLGANLGF